MALFNRDNISGEDPEDDDYLPEDFPPNQPRKNKKRPFLALIIILVGLLLLVLAGLVILAPRYFEARRAERLNQAAYLNAANTATASAAAGGVEEAAFPTIAFTEAPQEIAQIGTPGLSVDELATVSALQTQMAPQETIAPTQPPVVIDVPETQSPTTPSATDEPTTPQASDVPQETEVSVAIETVIPLTTNTEPFPATQESGTTGLTEAPLPAEETTPVVTPQSQVAAGEGTSTEVLATELPDTGVADNLRLPLLAGAAIILVLVIVLSRRLRLSAR